MDLYYWKGANGQTNFGDELNNHIWDLLIPEVLSGQNPGLFLGIGTIINHLVPVDEKIFVFGSGVGYGNIPNDVSTWRIYFVRGPLSAKVLGIHTDFAITDPAVL